MDSALKVTERKMEDYLEMQLTIEPLINGEALLLAKYVRNRNTKGVPRIAVRVTRSSDN
jgi:hypothetical protein